MINVTITTDGIERNFTYGHELSNGEWEQFEGREGYPDEDDKIGEHFIRHGEGLYLESDFAEVGSRQPAFQGWDMWMTSGQHGLLLRYVNNFNGIVLGQFAT